MRLPVSILLSFSTIHEPSQYHLAPVAPSSSLLPAANTASSSSPPPINPPTAAKTNPLPPAPSIPTAVTMNSNSSGLGLATSSIVNGDRQQQYHRPLMRGVQEISTAGTTNSSDGKENKRKYSKALLLSLDRRDCSLAKESLMHSNNSPVLETLPFENYRTNSTGSTANNFLPQTNVVARRNTNNNYAGANRLSDGDEEDDEDDEDEDDREREEDDDDQQNRMRRKANGQNFVQPSRPSEVTGFPSSPSKNTSARPSSTSSTTLMMMKGNGMTGGDAGPPAKQVEKNNRSAYEFRSITAPSSLRPTSSGSSSSSSSLPVDEHQQRHLKPRRYNFVPAPFNGSRLLAKSTEQLNRSLLNDSATNYSTPPTTPPTVPSFQGPVKSDSPTSILKQNTLQKYAPSTVGPSPPSKRMPIEWACLRTTRMTFLLD